MANLNDELYKVMKKYRDLFHDLNLEIHTTDCHSDCIHVTFWVKENDIVVDIFPVIFCYDIDSATGRWEEPEFDPEYDETYEDGYMTELVDEKQFLLNELNAKTLNF